MSEASFENLISAYMDDELSPGERARAEKLIAEDSSAAELLESLRTQSGRIKALPRFKLADDFADRLMESPAFADAVASSDDRIVTTDPTPVGRPLKWSMAAAAIGSLAALIFVTLVMNPSAPTTNTNLAMKEPADSALEQAQAAGLVDDDAEDEKLAVGDAPRQRMKTNSNLGAPKSEAKAFKPDEISVDRSMEKKSKGKRNSDFESAPKSQSAARSAAKLERMDSKSDMSASPGSIESDAMQRIVQDTADGKMQSEKDMLARGAAPAKSKKSARANRSFDSEVAENDSNRLAKAEERSLAESANGQSNVAPQPLAPFADKSNTLVEAGKPGASGAGTVEHLIEIVLPGLNAAQPYDFAAFRASMSRNGIQMSDAPAGAKTDTGVVPSDQALYVVASPNQMRRLVSELAANRVGISSFGFGSVNPSGAVQSQSAFAYQATKQSNIEFREQSGSGAGGGFGGGGGAIGGGASGNGVVDGVVVYGGGVAASGQPQQNGLPSRAESFGQSFGNEGANQSIVAGGGAVFGAPVQVALTPEQINQMVGADSTRDVAGQPRRYFFLIRRANSALDSSLVPATPAPAIPSQPAGK